MILQSHLLYDSIITTFVWGQMDPNRTEISLSLITSLCTLLCITADYKVMHSTITQTEYKED